jgi:hypothetical protein
MWGATPQIKLWPIISRPGSQVSNVEVKSSADRVPVSAAGVGLVRNAERDRLSEIDRAIHRASSLWLEQSIGGRVFSKD